MGIGRHKGLVRVSLVGLLAASAVLFFFSSSVFALSPAPKEAEDAEDDSAGYETPAPVKPATARSRRLAPWQVPFF